jgi:type II secretory ATPase GspE/PulE/Tfp pilus assembly ATPase PilB-like protein
MDPDVLLVSEIRDPETAETVMRAASAGRYVVSTMHARDAAASLTALQAMRISEASMAANLVGIISQRLIRRLCTHCRRTRAATADEQQLFRDERIEPPTSLCDPVGCGQCGGTGFHGRTAVAEAVAIDGELAEAVKLGGSPDDIRRSLRASGVCSLEGDALLKVREHITSLDEASSLAWV